MKNIFTFLFIFIFTIISSVLNGQFVTISEKQFKSGGSDFYPLVMNYNIAITHNPGTTEYYTTPDGSYGAFPYYECASGDICLQNDFSKIAAMGFNTIRIGFGPIYRQGITGPSSREFVMQYNDNLGPNQYLASWQFRDLSYPDFNNQASRDYFNIIKHVLDLAGIAGLKVILLTISPGPKDLVTSIRKYYPVYDARAAAEYAVYLEKLSNELKDHPALLAYDLFNEPIYNNAYMGNVNGAQIEWTKQDICNFERQWYDAIKPLNDPNHLITIGCASTDEVFYWDMGNLKLDFFSLHSYPDYNEFVYPSDLQTSIYDGMSKFTTIMYWMSQVCPMPWIIGETGFSADDDTSDPTHLDADPAHHAPPFMFGSESQQEQFAEQSLADARNAGASGYSWWSFQNVYWYHYLPPHPIEYPGCMNQNYFGLLHYGNGTPTWLEKPAVNTFETYLSSGQPPPVVPLAEPSNYFDPYNIHFSLNTSATNSVSGYVYDDKGNPIKNAVVYGTNWLNTDNVSIPPKFNFSKPPLTFTDQFGYFQIAPYNFAPAPFTSDPHRIININITAVGAERDCEGSCGWPYYDAKMTQTSLPNIPLKKVTTGYDAIASNETVLAVETRNYYGWNSLNAYNLTLNGISNLTARKEINANSEFEAARGSNVHIFISDGYTDCGDFNGFFRTIGPYTSTKEPEQNSSKEIEVSFIDSKYLNAQIYPNPNSGIFTISIQNHTQDAVSIKLQNILSETLWSTQTNNTNVFANFDFLAKGIYFMQIRNQKQFITKTLIIN